MISAGDRKGRKGNVSVEIVIIMAVLFVFSIVAVVTYDFFSEIVDDVVSDDDYSSTATAPAENLRNDYPSIFDTAFVIILSVLWIGTVALAFQIDSHPVFFGVSLLALIVILAVPPVLGNAFEETFDDSTTVGLTDNFPIMSYVMTHSLQFAIFMGATVLISLYAKSRMGF